MIDAILQSINTLLAQDSNDDAEKRALLGNSNNLELRKLAGKLNTRDILVVANVHGQSPLPQKHLPALIKMSQPTATRAVQRLVQQGLLIRSRIPNNDKEWQLTLTPLGEEVAAAKRDLDQQLHAKAQAIAAHYSDEELARFNEFIGEIINLKVTQPKEK